MVWFLVGVSWVCGIVSFSKMFYDHYSEGNTISVGDVLMACALSIFGFIILPLSLVLIQRKPANTEASVTETTCLYEPEETGWIPPAKEGEPCPNCGVPVGYGGVYCNCNYGKPIQQFNFGGKPN